jgi:hypothetical protein
MQYQQRSYILRAQYGTAESEPSPRLHIDPPLRGGDGQRRRSGLFAMRITIVASAVLATSVSAHTIFTQLHVNGVAQGHLKGVRVPVHAIDTNVVLVSY